MTRIIVIDLKFQGYKNAIAAFLIKTPIANILIDTGPSSSLPVLLKALKSYQLEASDISHVFLTHVHLDHAGAAWHFADLGAQVYVHSKGLPHLHKPERLWNSAKRIYGDDMEKLWGEMQPIAASQLNTVAHKKRVKIGDLKIRALHTPGHAVHHIAWEIGDNLFCGDVAGIRLANGPVMPPCPPPDINITHWKNSIALILSRRYKKLYLAHFGEVTDVRPHLLELRGRLTNWATWIYPYYEAGMSQKEILPKFLEYVNKQLQSAGISKKHITSYEVANPAWMSVAGLYRYYASQKSKSKS